MSRHLRQPLEYFVADEAGLATDDESFKARFRALGLHPVDEDAVWAFEQRCRDYLWLEQALGTPVLSQPPRYGLPPPTTPEQARTQGEELAAAERNRLNLGQGPLRDPFDVVESQGIRLILMALESPNVSGVFRRVAGGVFILVNTAFPCHRWPFDLLHEYCHVLVDEVSGVHRFDDSGDDALIEQRANIFAAAFLLPEEGARRFLATKGVQPGAVRFSDVLRVMVVFGLSYQATLYRLLELGYLDDRTLAAFKEAENIEDMVSRMRRAEMTPQNDLDGPVSRRFGQLVLRAYAQEVISIGRAVELLDVDLDQVQEFAQIWQTELPSPLELAIR